MLFKSLRMERENETVNTDTHFILGKETKLEYLERSFFANITEPIASHHCRSGNCHAITFLSGSIEHKFVSRNIQEMAYQYQKPNQYEQKSLLWKIVHAAYYGEKWVTRKFEQSINDDSECFQSRMLENGINGYDVNETINTFHYQMLDENQVKVLRNSIANYNKNLSFFKRFYANVFNSMEKANSNDTYVRSNCKRVTMYFNRRTRLKRIRHVIVQHVIVQLTKFSVYGIIHVLFSYF